MSPRILAAGLVLVAVALAYWGFAGRKPLVGTATLRTGVAADIVYATGVVEPARWAAIAPLLRERIVETCDCEGEFVEAGRVIFRLDDSEARARLAELDARLMLAQSQLKRAADLLGRRVGTEQAYDEAASRVAELQAGRAAQAEKLGAYVSKAPLDGQVLRLDGDVGEVVSPGEPLAWVGRPSPKQVVADVNEEDVPRVAVGQTALIKADAFPNADLRAAVSSITPKGDTVLKTYRVRLSLPEDTPLFIGMTVETNIVIREAPGAVLAPAAALVRADDGLAVFVVENGVARRAPVTVGMAAADVVELIDGPPVGAVLVSPAIDALEDGQSVRVARDDP